MSIARPLLPSCISGEVRAVLVLLHRHGFRIAEAPVEMRASDSGQSIHRGLRPLFYLFKMALAIPLNLLRKE